MKPKAEIRIMTKELVDTLLGMNTKNRTIKQKMINVYKTEISKGNWMLTNQGVGVSSDMVLIDGQHRLIALKESRYPQLEMVVVWGLDPASQKCVDIHAKRSMRDIFHFVYDTKIGGLVPAICAMIQKMTGAMLLNGAVVPSQSFETYDEYKEEIDALNAIPTGYKLSSPVLAALVMMFKKHPDRIDDITQFMIRVKKNENLNRKMPEWHLNSFLASSVKSGGSVIQKERYIKTVKAIECFLEGKEMGVLRA
jgi:hypothetical protein